jgi:hypothetical protein
MQVRDYCIAIAGAVILAAAVIAIAYVIACAIPLPK